MFFFYASHKSIMHLTGNERNLFSMNANISAVLDLGTNTFHLLVLECSSDGVKPLSRLQIPVKLGEGGINKGFIEQAAYQRGQSALLFFAQELKKYAVKNVKAFATSAIRDASNGVEFMQEVKTKTGIEIGTITGEEEAIFICEGVRHSLPFTVEPYLIMDIGGGSVEFIIANKYTLFWKRSYRLGAARLIEKYHRQDPMGAEEKAALYTHVIAELSELWEKLEEHKVATLIGSAGSFESVVDLIAELTSKDCNVFSEHSKEVELTDYFKIHRILLASTTAERKQMKGLADFRVEMMVAASCLIDIVLTQSSIKRMIASSYSLKEGIVYSML
jgi:exopolyphosphatase/guanosine-5'-triphosphate,3'-diphosphate pyrophosphatase